ncbi:two component transcriptional regulator, LuxR family [Agrococcus baldri]|uniref:Two component transcriptional regulator, LuxR family n=1 Tax=Agrococcus baldri TaxID=153730 RepID=A0AA94HNR0_9MICO|nr:response regulator transcription factor [Agrococcus baldri]SFS15605.1 two component transcriptional regulator, LuxR family [Agrococcus baldri]
MNVSRDGAAPSVLVVDDQELVRAGFRLILERAGHPVVGEAGDGVEAIEQVALHRPDVVLMDVRMPRMDGIEATRRIMAAARGAAAGGGSAAAVAGAAAGGPAGDAAPKVLALTTFDLDEHVWAAVQAGASGFLLKDVSPGDLVHAVRAVARGDRVLSPAVTARLLDEFARRPLPGALPPAIAALTPREAEVARSVARGMSNAEIGERLFLSDATVKTYLSRLLAKLGLRDRVQLAVLAYESGLVRVGEAE